MWDNTAKSKFKILSKMSTRSIVWTVANAKTDLDEFLGLNMDLKLKVFKRDENKQFPLAQNLTMGEADFNQFNRLRNQLVVAVRDVSKEENLPPVHVKLLAKDMEEQLKLTHKVAEVVGRPLRKICVTTLRYNVEKPETSYVRVRLFGRKKDEEKFNQIVYVMISV